MGDERRTKLRIAGSADLVGAFQQQLRPFGAHASMAPTAGAQPQLEWDTFAPAYQRPPPAPPAAKPDSIEPPAAPFGEAGEVVFSSTTSLGGS